MKSVYGQYICALQEAGVFVDTDWLHPADTATTLSMKSGEAIVHDGPVAEIRETLGGYFVIDVPGLDAALKWAEKGPTAHAGKVEVRAFALGQMGRFQLEAAVQAVHAERHATQVTNWRALSQLYAGLMQIAPLFHDRALTLLITRDKPKVSGHSRAGSAG